nr:conserved hypothetical protein [Hymenolepis microstoma]
MSSGGKKHKNAKLLNSITIRHLQRIKTESGEELEARRKKLADIFERENAGYEKTYQDLLRMKEIARKEAVIDLANKMRKLIQAKTEEIAKREYAAYLNQNNEESRLCKPIIFNALIKQDQEAINEYKKQQKAYEKTRELQLLQQGDNFTAKLFTDDENRTKNRTGNRNLYRKELLKQIYENERNRELVKFEEAEEKKILEEVVQTESEAEKEKELTRKQQLHENLRSQLEEMMLRIKREKETDLAIGRSINQYWMPIASSESDRKNVEDLKNQSKSFIEYQQRMRNHQNLRGPKLDKIVLETAEKVSLERHEREKARKCYLRTLERTNNEANRRAALEKVLKRPIQRAQEIEEQARELAEVQQRDAELEKKIKFLEEAKREELRMNLEKQIQEVNLRRELEKEEKMVGEGKEEECLGKCHKCICGSINLNVYNLHPMRKAALKKP